MSGRATDEEAMLMYRAALVQLIKDAPGAELVVRVDGEGGYFLPPGQILHKRDGLNTIRFRFVPAEPPQLDS